MQACADGNAELVSGDVTLKKLLFESGALKLMRRQNTYAESQYNGTVSNWEGPSET